MKLTINQEKLEFHHDITLMELLHTLDYKKSITVIINDVIIPRNNFINVTFREMDVIKIVRLIGGG